MSTEQWELIEPLLPSQKPFGRTRSTNLRLVLNAIFVIAHLGVDKMQKLDRVVI
jgi:transposase